MKADRIVLLLLVGVFACSIASFTWAEEPIQPVFSQYMKELDVWRGQFTFFRSDKGELVLLGSGSSAIASDDEGRTWHDWADGDTWPGIAVSAIARRGNELFIHPDSPDLRVYRSKDGGKTWDDGHLFMQWPKLVAIPNGPRQDHPDERYRGKALLWGPSGDRIVVNQEGHLVVSVTWLLGGEGTGPELVGSMISEDDGVTWRCYELFGPPRGYRDRPEGFAEPKPVLLSDGRMWMVFRTPLGHLWQAFSEDGGRTWGEPSSTGLVSLLGPLNAQRVPGKDTVVVVFANAPPTATTEWRVEHNFWFPRRPMVFAVSHDHCKTWSQPVVITEKWGYMRNIFFSDKEMFINYEEGTSGKHLAPGFQYRPRLVIYDLKDVLALDSHERQ